VPYVVVDADEIEPGFGCVFRQTRRRLGVRACRPHAGPDGLSWVVVGAPPREDWEPEL
jgi:hypothetical protein